MKKMLLALTAVLMVSVMVSCGKKEAETETETETAAETETQQTASPMEMVMDDVDFAKELGFHIDTSAVPVPGMARFIIDDKIAQMRFAVEPEEEEEAEPVDVMFRATKDASLKDSLSGISGERSQPVSVSIAGVPVTKTDFSEGGRTYHQYDFEKDGIYCCFVVTGELEQEKTEEFFTAFYNALSSK